MTHNADVTVEALRMCARELAGWREWADEPFGDYSVNEVEVDDTVEEMLSKARGFSGEDS